MSGRTARERRKKQRESEATESEPIPDEQDDEPGSRAASVEQPNLDDHELTVLSGTTAVDGLYREMLGDLDIERGGFGWWHGYTDSKRIALISEYLLASVQGVSSALLSASLQVDIHRRRLTADTHWIRTRWAAVPRQVANPTVHDYLAAIRRGPRERVRDAEIALSAEHAFYHLAQVLDRLAACVIGVAGLDADIVKADWRDIEKAVEAARRTTATGGLTAKKPLYSAGTPGRAAQKALLDLITREVDRGPDDWLAWMVRQRDTLSHRAPKLAWKLLDKRPGKVDGSLVTPFWAQPGWSEVEAFVRKQSANGPADMVLMEDPQETLVRFVAQTTALTATTVEALQALWRDRKADTQLIVQPGGQWRSMLDQASLRFSGFGVTAIDVGNGPGLAAYLAPENGVRMQASKVMDSGREFWRKQ